MSNLIRLTRIDPTGRSGPVEILMNPDHISTVEARKVDDRYVLLIKTLHERNLVRYAAVDAVGSNTIKEESAEEVLDKFRRYVD